MKEFKTIKSNSFNYLSDFDKEVSNFLNKGFKIHEIKTETSSASIMILVFLVKED
jgi:hypothetical protein